MSNKDLVLAASKIRDRHALPQHDGRARRAGHPRAAEPPGRRPRRASCSRPSTACCSAAATRSSASTRRPNRSTPSRAILRGARPADRRARRSRPRRAAWPTSRTQLACLERGAPVDLLFQSVAGTEAANRSFGINLALLREGRERVLEHHRGARRAPGSATR